jgi:hypothetical protein
MESTFHIRAKKDYVILLLEVLKKEGAIEDLELQRWELSEAQKIALDKELDLIEGTPDYLQKWDDVKHRFKKHK